LSGATTKDHYDKCIVYPDAWEVITKKRFGILCTNNFIDSFDKINTKWGSKQSTMIFRGANKTIYQLDKNKNERIKVTNILKKIKNKYKTDINIDVGLINYDAYNNFIDDKMNSENKKEILNLLYDKKFTEKMSMYEQSNSKYILNIDGYANAWRLCFELSYNSCIILLLSQYYSWFYDKLKHMKNVYIIDVNSKTLEEDLLSCLEKLERNDNIGKKIAEGSVKLYNEIMNFNYIRNYMTSLLTEKESDIIIK